MNYPLKLQGFENQVIEVQSGGAFSGAKLLLNGSPAPKGPKWGQMLLRRDNGQEVTATWKQRLGSFDIPQLVVDGQAIHIVEPLKWYALIWCGLPMALVFAGGALGGIAGAIGFSVNSKIFRSNINGFAKYLLAGGVSILSAVVYLIVAALFLSLISG
ncbi:MAG: hypothetical protein R2911_32740 [Caldilineaceae bacterium]